MPRSSRLAEHAANSSRHGPRRRGTSTSCAKTSSAGRPSGRRASTHSAERSRPVTRRRISSPVEWTWSVAPRMTLRPSAGPGPRRSATCSWLDLSLSLSAPPLLPSASGPTLENQVSRVTGALTQHLPGRRQDRRRGGGVGFVEDSPVSTSSPSNTVLLTSAIFSQPDSQPHADSRCCGGSRRSGRSAAFAPPCSVVGWTSFLPNSIAVRSRRAAFQDLLLEVDEQQHVVASFRGSFVVGFRQLRLADIAAGW